MNLLTLCGLALVIGVMTGFGAVGFRALIALVHNLLLQRQTELRLRRQFSEGPSRFGDFLLSPIIGGLIVVYIVRTFAPEAKGHGVPEVMDAVFYKHGNIRGKVAIIKALASALSIGSGAAVGREGPIIQIGSALGSAFSQFIGLSTWQTDHAAVGRRRRRHRRDVQYAARRRVVRPRDIAARSLKSHLSPRRRRDRSRDDDRQDPDRTRSGLYSPDVQFSLAPRCPGEEAMSFVCSDCSAACCLGLHSPARDHGGRLSETAGKRIHPEHRRNGHHRTDDGRPDPRLRSSLCRWRRLFA